MRQKMTPEALLNVLFRHSTLFKPSIYSFSRDLGRNPVLEAAKRILVK